MPAMLLKTIRALIKAALIKAALILVAIAVPPAHAANATLIVPPFLPEAEMRETYSPMMEFIAKHSGIDLNLQTHPNYLAYWQATLNGYNRALALDPAPIVDFRAQRQGWAVLAQLEDSISQTLAVHQDNLVIDPAELVNKPLAVMPSPSLSALVMYQIFPNPLQQPELVFKDSSRDVAEALFADEVEAIVIPTPLMSGYPELVTVTSTEPLPSLGFSATPDLSSDEQSRLREAILALSRTTEGQRLLEESGLRPVVPASNADYQGQAKLLEGTFGY